MFDIQIHAVLSSAVFELLQAISILRVNSFEYQVECRICFSGEAQNSVGLVRPNEFAAVNLPSKGPRMTQSLSLCQILPSSLQIGLRSVQLFFCFFYCGCSLTPPLPRT